MIYRTHCSLRLGDNIAALHFLRKLAIAQPEDRFIHYAHLDYIPQLAEIVCDLQNLQLGFLEHVCDSGQGYWNMTPRPLLRSVNTWKNSRGDWEVHPQRNDFAAHSISHWARVAFDMNLDSPIASAADLLLDYPALARGRAHPFDVLVINSKPQSGQWHGFDSLALDGLIGEMALRHSVITTAPTRFEVPCTTASAMTVSQIGALSRFCKYIIMIATGPAWPTFNVYNLDSVKFRLILIGEERINLSPNTDHASTISEARRVLQVRGII